MMPDLEGSKANRTAYPRNVERNQAKPSHRGMAAQIPGLTALNIHGFCWDDWSTFLWSLGPSQEFYGWEQASSIIGREQRELTRKVFLMVFKLVRIKDGAPGLSDLKPQQTLEVGLEQIQVLARKNNYHWLLFFLECSLYKRNVLKWEHFSITSPFIIIDNSEDCSVQSSYK